MKPRTYLVVIATLVFQSVRAQIHELTYSMGAGSIQGEFSDLSTKNLNAVFGIGYAFEPDGWRHWRFGGQFKFSQFQLGGISSPADWRSGIAIKGQGITALVTARYVLGSNVNYNAYSGMLLPYVELGAGMYFSNVEDLTEGRIYNQFTSFGTYSTPLGHFAVGTSIMINQSWGVHLAGGGQYSMSDALDGVTGTGSADDVLVYGEVGITWMVPFR